MITVVIPVGHNKVYREYLQECLDSLKNQTVIPSEVLIIDDMADVRSWELDYSGLENVMIYSTPWLVGVPTAFNFGVSLAQNDLIIMLGSDDKLQPWAISDALNAWEQHKDPLGYYYFDIEYSDTGEMQNAANNCAMVTKELWKHTGGFPVQSVVGACDHIFLSMIMAAEGKAGNIIRIESGQPPYWYRRHKESATNVSNLGAAIMAVKTHYTKRAFKSPEWGRYE